jgi:heme-degrading monooxygenase HmoA
MFARKVAVCLKPNSLTEFTRLMESEIIPWLRQQDGFLDLITLAVPDSSEVATISFWEREDHQQAYQESGYPEALKILGKLLDGTPYVKTFEVISSTLHRTAPVRPTGERNRARGAVTPKKDSREPGYRLYDASGAW